MATQEEIWFVRQLLGEASAESEYSDDFIAQLIDRHPVGTSTEHDLNSAAADGWQVKAAKLADQISFSADGASFQLSQKHMQALNMARTFRSRRGTRSVTVTTVQPTVPTHPVGFPPEQE